MMHAAQHLETRIPIRAGITNKSGFDCLRRAPVSRFLIGLTLLPREGRGTPGKDQRGSSWTEGRRVRRKKLLVHQQMNAEMFTASVWPCERSGTSSFSISGNWGVNHSGIMQWIMQRQISVSSAFTTRVNLSHVILREKKVYNLSIYSFFHIYIFKV